MSGRPLDVLEASVGDEVVVRLKSGETYTGTLAGYDQHMNLVLDDLVASPADESGTASGGATEQESDASEGDAVDDGASVDTRDTTIIRGDNVVSITP